MHNTVVVMDYLAISSGIFQIRVEYQQRNLHGVAVDMYFSIVVCDSNNNIPLYIITKYNIIA
jgi:hypothetical protein